MRKAIIIINRIFHVIGKICAIIALTLGTILLTVGIIMVIFSGDSTVGDLYGSSFIATAVSLLLIEAPLFVACMFVSVIGTKKLETATCKNDLYTIAVLEIIFVCPAAGILMFCLPRDSFSNPGDNVID